MTTSRTKMFRRFFSTTIFTSALVFSAGAQAQLSQQTGVADPGRIEKSINEGRLVPQVGPNVSVKSLALQNAPSGAERVKFKFGGLNVEGLGVYDADDVYPIYADKIGTEITLADLYGIANQMTLQYRNDGYVLTQVVVPPQTIENGIARLQVVEGFIDNVIIQGGDQSPSELQLIQDYASRISQGGALNISDMERQLLLINDLPGVTARSVISPSATTAGAADMLVIIERDPYEALVGVNNHGSRFLGPFQAQGVGILNSVLGLNEKITAQTVVAPDGGMELAYGSLAYEQPIGSLGTTLEVSGSMTNTDPGFTLKQFDVAGKSRSYTIKAKHPFIRSRNSNLFGRVLFDYRNVESLNNVEATRHDKIRALRAGLQAEFLDRLLGVGVNTVDLEVSKGIDIFGASDEGDPNMTRPAGDPQFTKGNLILQRLQRLTNRFNLLLQGRGQLSNKPLLSSEEFGLGGIGTVRGFAPSEVVGDDALAGKAELQWNNESRMLQLFGFFDAGKVWNQDATTSSGKKDSLTSAGGGVRLNLPMDVDAEFVMAVPLNRDIQTRNEQNPQFFFSVNKKF